jgi:tetratricopeptide (TPR) repeat protein
LLLSEPSRGHVPPRVSLRQRGNFDGAIAEERAALKRNPKNAEAHLGLSLTFAKQGDLKLAIEECRLAVELASDSEPAKTYCDNLAAQQEKK